MANRTVKEAKSVHGTNPQYLIEKIIRSRIYECRFWKEQCFALNAELLVERAQQIRFTGGVYGGSIKPTPFLCLALKMLQIQPEKEIVIEMIRQSTFKYIRVLAAFYWRLVASSVEVYTILEPLVNDFRKLKRLERDGTVSIICVDEFVDALLREERVCDVILPRIQKRYIIESQNELEPRASALDEDLENAATSSSDDTDADEEEPATTSRTRGPTRREVDDNDADERDVERRTKSSAKRREADETLAKEKKRLGNKESVNRKRKHGSEEREEGEAGSSSGDERDESPRRRKRSRSRSKSNSRAHRRQNESPARHRDRDRERDRGDSDRRRNEKREYERERDRGGRQRNEKSRSRRSRSRSRSRSGRSRSGSRDRRRDRR